MAIKEGRSNWIVTSPDGKSPGAPDRQTLAEMMVGKTGNLRAPTVLIGKFLVVGFDEEMYEYALNVPG